MAEVWAAAAITVVGGVVAGAGAEKKDKSDKAFQQAMTREESELAAQRTGYEMALSDYYSQKERARKQRGLDQYKSFNTMGAINPAYDVNGEPRINPGEAPKYGDFVAGGNSGGGEVQKGVASPSTHPAKAALESMILQQAGNAGQQLANPGGG